MDKKRLVRRIAILTLMAAVGVTMCSYANASPAYAADPGKPTLQSAKAKSRTTIALKWSRVSNVTGYEVFQAKGGTTDYKKIACVKGSASRTFKDTDLEPGTKYKYKVRAYQYTGKKQTKWYNTKTGKWQKTKPASRYCGASKKFRVYKRSKYSGVLTATTKEEEKAEVILPPENVDSIIADASGKRVGVTWEESPGATGYEVYRSETEDFGDVPIYYSAKNRYCDQDILPGGTYYYKVVPYTNGKSQTAFGEDSDTISATVPEPDEQMLPEGVSITEEGITLQWEYPQLSDEEIDAIIDDENAEFKRFLCQVIRNDVVLNSAKFGTTFTDTAVEDGETYTYQIVPHLSVKKDGEYQYIALSGEYIQSFTVTFQTEGTVFENHEAELPFPEAPEGFTVSAGFDSASMTWEKGKRAAAYAVYRDGIKIGETEDTIFEDPDLLPGTDYTFEIVPIGYRGNEGSRAAARIKTEGNKPSGDPDLRYTENRNVTLQYGDATIHLGQTWSSDLKQKLAAGCSGTDEEVAEGYLYVELLREDRFVLKEAVYDEHLYFFDTGDYDDFLLVRVANNQIVKWETTRQVMGQEGSEVLQRGDMGPYPAHAADTFVPYNEDTEKCWGLYLGGFQCDEYEQLNFAYAKEDLVAEKKLGFHAINAFRVAAGRGVLKYNDHLDGTGKAFTGTITKVYPGTYENYIYGAQPWAETMFASNRLSHNGPMSAGPLAGDRETACSRNGIATYLAHLSISGENVANSDAGMGALVSYANSPGHMQTILNRSSKHIGIGVCNMYHCEIYADDLDPAVEARIY